MGAVLRYLFDLTTSAHWVGPAVGIVRVEAELARRARQHVGDDLTFCVYDKYRNLVLGIDDETAANLIDDKLHFRIDPPSNPISRGVRAMKRGLRRAVLLNAGAYHALQRLRGRSFTRQEIGQIRERQLALWCEPSKPLPPIKPLKLDSNTTIISGGLDWDHKDFDAIATLKQQSGFRYCGIVYDLIPVLFPHFIAPEYLRPLTTYFSALPTVTDRVMCISEVTRRDWLAHCGRLGQTVPADVFPLGSDLPRTIDAEGTTLPSQLAGKRYALFVSTIEPRKNHRVLYDAWDDCMRQGLVDAERDRLVFVGRRGWAVNDLLNELPRNLATRDTIVVLNHVPDAELDAIYRHCAFVVFPSHYEGFGLPLAEALGYGKPCISNNAGALSEIGGDLVIRLGAKDTPAWTRAIAHYMRSPDELDAWSDRIAREYQPTNWDMAAKIFFSTVTQAVWKP
jgi:glycosyltransferase involved in cell wall biosynthesis